VIFLFYTSAGSGIGLNCACSARRSTSPPSRRAHYARLGRPALPASVIGRGAWLQQVGRQRERAERRGAARLSSVAARGAGPPLSSVWGTCSRRCGLGYRRPARTRSASSAWTPPARPPSCTSCTWARLSKPPRPSAQTSRSSPTPTCSSTAGTSAARARSGRPGARTLSTRTPSSSSSTVPVRRVCRRVNRWRRASAPPLTCPRSSPRLCVPALRLADHDRLDLAREELHAILTSDDLAHACLLVYANKQDLPKAASAAELSETLALHSIRDHDWHIQACSALSGDGLYEGLDWVTSRLKKASSPR
jgi:hypothetical protein